MLALSNARWSWWTLFHTEEKGTRGRGERAKAGSPALLMTRVRYQETPNRCFLKAFSATKSRDCPSSPMKRHLSPLCHDHFFLFTKIGERQRPGGAADFAAIWPLLCCGFSSAGVFPSPDLLTHSTLPPFWAGLRCVRSLQKRRRESRLLGKGETDDHRPCMDAAVCHYEGGRISVYLRGVERGQTSRMRVQHYQNSTTHIFAIRLRRDWSRPA